MTSTEFSSEFEALIVFGYGPVLPGNRPGAGRLNVFGRLNAMAAGMLYQGGEISTMIPTGGRTGGPQLPSEAYLIAEIASSKFGIPSSALLLEEEATDTITNLVRVANLLDRRPGDFNRLLFVCLGFHLPRVRAICSLVSLEGNFVAAESIVRTRSARYEAFLRALLDPDREGYARILSEQELWLGWLAETPEIWLPEMAKIESSDRLERILRMERLGPFMRGRGIDVSSGSLADMRLTISSMRPSEKRQQH